MAIVHLNTPVGITIIAGVRGNSVHTAVGGSGRGNSVCTAVSIICDKGSSVRTAVIIVDGRGNSYSKFKNKYAIKRAALFLLTNFMP